MTASGRSLFDPLPAGSGDQDSFAVQRGRVIVHIERERLLGIGKPGVPVGLVRQYDATGCGSRNALVAEVIVAPSWQRT